MKQIDIVKLVINDYKKRSKKLEGVEEVMVPGERGCQSTVLIVTLKGLVSSIRSFLRDEAIKVPIDRRHLPRSTGELSFW